MEFDTDVVVIGAGIVGLAAAAALARAGRSVVIVERHDAIARETTSRNSEVIHAGLYYPAGSLKATLCREGREILYARCVTHGIPHRKLGKLVVASEGREISDLEDLHRRAQANGAPGLAMLDREDIRRLEPDVRAIAALHSPESGIVDGHALCLSYLAEAETHGAVLALRSEVLDLGPVRTGWQIEVTSSERYRLTSRAVVNAAGLASDRVAERAGLDLDAMRYRQHRCKGDYFSLSPSGAVDLHHLIYPLPVQAGLGVHATLDLAGRVRFGPDAEYVQDLDYTVDPDKRAAFAQSIGAYLPQIEAAMLEPEYAGIRPKLAGPGEEFRDFVINEESQAGLPGLVSCIGIESPGLTAAGAIGERICDLLRSL